MKMVGGNQKCGKEKSVCDRLENYTIRAKRKKKKSRYTIIFYVSAYPALELLLIAGSL